MPDTPPSTIPMPLRYEQPSADRWHTWQWDGRELRIEIEPMSAWTFVAVIFDRTVIFGLAVGLIAALASQRQCEWPVFLVLTAFAGVSGLSILRAFRNRRVPRLIWASQTSLGYSDIRTAGRPRWGTRRGYGPVAVFRCRGRSWAFELVAHPMLPKLRIVHAEPIRLAIDTDRDRLETMAEMIEAARRPPDEGGHVRGAFEVVPMTPAVVQGNVEQGPPARFTQSQDGSAGDDRV